jgi:signal transduction histidine kinase
VGVVTDDPGVADRLRLLESCVRGIVFEFDEVGRYLALWTNDESLLARPRRELIGRTVEEVLGREAAAPFVTMIREVLRDGLPVTLEYQLAVLGGMRWFQAEGFPGGRPRTVVFLVKDITERKRMEAHVLDSDRLAAIGLLAGGVGHEINNPLSWMIARLSGLRDALVDAGRTGHVEPSHIIDWSRRISDALEGAERIRQIVADLGFFTRSPESERTRVHLPVPIDWAVEMAMVELGHRARVVKRFEPAPPVLGSEARLGQVVLNLLINAAQAIPSGDPGAHEVGIALSTSPTGEVLLDVTDTGCGIPSEHLDRLFEPFFTTKPRGSGTGLGLSVCRSIVESLGGRIEVTSSIDRGSRFRVVLPPAPPPTGEPTPTATLEGRPRVLLLDDQPRMLFVLAAGLNPLFEVVEQTSAREALAALRRGERFDAVVCDLMMPEVSGMEFYEVLRREFPSVADRVVFMTGGVFTEDAREFMTHVSNPCIQKPFDPEALEDALRRVLG